MKYVIILTIILGISFSPVFADNSLQNTTLYAESAVISLDIKFGEDTINILIIFQKQVFFKYSPLAREQV